jgi:hypothetical protein
MNNHNQSLLSPSLLTLLICHVITSSLTAQSPQNPSPMVEHIREHRRLEKQNMVSERISLSVGTLAILQQVREQTEMDSLPLVIAFHCGDWIPEIAVDRLNPALPCLMIQLGGGSSRYAKPFAEDPDLLKRLVDEVEKHLNKPVSSVILVGWSAGYGAIGQILRQQGSGIDISAVLLIDGLHTGYVGGKPGPEESELQTEGLEPFLRFARAAVEGERRMMIVHSEIFPGTYASTTETADWLLKQLNLRRQAVLRWGPMQTQVIGETVQGDFIVRAFAGNSAPDHIDLLHALPELLLELLGER